MIHSTTSDRSLVTRLIFSAALGGFLFLLNPAQVLAVSETWPVRKALLVSSARVDASCLVGNKVPVSLREALAKVPLGLISSPLGELVLEKSVVTQLLGSLAKYLELPEVIQIRRKGDLLSGEEIVEAVKRRFQERLSDDQTGKIEMDLSRLPHHVVLPGPLKSWDVRPVSQNTLGMVIFSLEADCEGGKVRQILQAEVWKTLEVAKLRRLVKRGEMVRESDLEKTVVRIKNPGADTAVPYEEAIGRPLATFKSAGTIIRASDIRACALPVSEEVEFQNTTKAPRAMKPEDYSLPAINTVRRTENLSVSRSAFKAVPPVNERDSWAVKPGDRVEFGVQMGGLSLTVPARATEGGKVGDSIRLVNLQNQRPIVGKIVSPGKVEHAEN